MLLSNFRVPVMRLSPLKTRPIAISHVLRVFSDGQTDRQTDRPTDRPTDRVAYRVACTRLKIFARRDREKERESALGCLYRLQNIGVRLVFGNIVPIAEIDNILPYRAVMSKIWYL